MKLSVKAFGFAGGILWGASLFIWTLLVSITEVNLGQTFLESLVGLYPAYSISIVGAFAGLIVGFLDVGIACVIFALLYNWASEKFIK